MPKIDRYLKKPEKNETLTRLRNIDNSYLINLDQRPMKLQQARMQLDPFGISPNRLSAIYGWSLTPDDLQEIGLQFQPGMDTGEKKQYKAQLLPHVPRLEPLDATCYGRACFHPRLSPGAIGCTLSHLSVLQDAYDAGHQTIWILEDDVSVAQNPHLLSDRIEELDRLDSNWDVLYTDDRSHFDAFTPGTVWRPDLPDLRYEPLYEYTPVGEEFIRIGGRCQTHSMILRRSGIEKILKFEKERGLFMAYDVEISFVPGIRFYNLKQEIVWGGIGGSDTDVKYFS
jgi:hypothetical protein